MSSEEGAIGDLQKSWKHRGWNGTCGLSQEAPGKELVETRRSFQKKIKEKDIVGEENGMNKTQQYGSERYTHE